MLRSFRVGNFRSIRDEQMFTLSIPTREARALGKERLPKAWDPDVSPVAAIYGANAAGKSAILFAVKFMVDAVAYSYQRWPADKPIPVQRFLLNSEHQAAPQLFDIEIIVEGVRYQYGFR